MNNNKSIIINTDDQKLVDENDIKKLIEPRIMADR